jgi:hypothetical protein
MGTAARERLVWGRAHSPVQRAKRALLHITRHVSSWPKWLVREASQPRSRRTLVLLAPLPAARGILPETRFRCPTPTLGTPCSHPPKAAPVQMLKYCPNTHCGKIDRSNLRKVAGLSHILGYSWIGHIISSKCASIFAQNAPNMSTYLSIPQERFRTGSRGSGAATAQRKFLSPSGRESTKRKHRRGDCCIRQEF